ncbi:MAG: hypothetical protein QGI29_05170 [Pirellulales bacterium]|nr:hypothetical protein [Pirellulales bacterium]
MNKREKTKLARQIVQANFHLPELPPADHEYVQRLVKWKTDAELIAVSPK